MALLGLLHALDPEKVDVDLFIYSHQGPLMKYIPEWVNILPEKPVYSVIERPMKEAIKRGHIGIVVARLLAKWKHRRYRRLHPAEGDDSAIFHYVADCIMPMLPQINPDVEYDLCISFLTPHNVGRDKVKAKKRIAWIHTDYSTVSINPDIELPVWGAYDKIVSISDKVTKSFLKGFPSLEDRIMPIENILPEHYIRSGAEELDASKEISMLRSEHSISLLSIGRYCHPKNYDNVPDITKKIIESGVTDLKWYIIGYGIDEDLIREKIDEAGMEDHVILLGKKENPYPYIKACDIFVQPSRYEGKSVTVREAQILGKPVAVTNYPTAASQIINGIDGVIVPLDNEGCARGLADFIQNIDLQNKIVDYLHHHDYAGADEVNKIYDLLR